MSFLSLKLKYKIRYINDYDIYDIVCGNYDNEYGEEE